MSALCGLRVVGGVLQLAGRLPPGGRDSLPRMGKAKTKAATTKKTSKAGKHAACGAELQKGATFCWHCKAPLGKSHGKKK